MRTNEKFSDASLKQLQLVNINHVMSSVPLFVTPKQSSTPYHRLTPLSKRIPFTFDRHTCDLPQHPLKLILAPQVKRP